MTFSGRIRMYLFAIAILPSLVLLVVIYYHLAELRESQARQVAFQALQRFDGFDRSLRTRTAASVAALATYVDSTGQMFTLLSGQASRLLVDPRTFGLDFLEILDSASHVVSSFHRPGLLGQQVIIPSDMGPDSAQVFHSVEYDVAGVHAAYSSAVWLNSRWILRSGRYLDEPDLVGLRTLLTAQVDLYLDVDTPLVFDAMAPRTLYRDATGYQAVLLGDRQARLFLVADFGDQELPAVGSSLLAFTILIAALAALVAIGLGMIITGRAKREIDNLVRASSRVAAGDFSVPVMAYEEGEFSLLADSLSEMMTNLRRLQSELAVAGKIAAWQQLGRKVAHELKNPLTPISIGIEDLHRSYMERQPAFEQILSQTTATIKNEIRRMTVLLDQFVSFARMKTPQPVTVNTRRFIRDLEDLYRLEIERARLKVIAAGIPANCRFDPDGIKQVLINLIKNGLEAGDRAPVTVTLTYRESALSATVEDDGPGFSEEKLTDPFQPYVTTKEDGSGLGLVIAYRIVHDHGGTMELYNRSEGGAGVRFVIPA